MVFWIVISPFITLGLIGVFLMWLGLRDWWGVEERIEWQMQDIGGDIEANERIQRLLLEPTNLTKGEKILTFHSTEENQAEYLKAENNMNTALSEIGESQEKTGHVGRASNIVFRQIQEPIPGCRMPWLFMAKTALE